MSLVEVRDLHVNFGEVQAVRGVSFDIESGETVALAGESGSGKSVTALSILQLLPYPLASHPKGSILVNGEQIIGEGLRVHNPEVSKEERRSRVREVMEEVGLDPDHMARYPHEFSGGQRQRISIARAMVLKPRFVVLDEPTSALDMSVQAQIVDLLRDLQTLSARFFAARLRLVRHRQDEKTTG